ncbi:thioredoxin domain-containing protein [Benzoatithermus flavus]|uniref:Thioredoxin domain-containing protein n=1 Tax=Benzoatithermus flavus TaxID=3108223 RepID=A0ABU8XYH4_9PROT
MANALAQATSPYLLQHADNPVDWQEWGEPALARAKAENKPILLSIGYAACHWCHVMAHESFENPDIAALMNRHFVNIKVDREERPDLDAVYQQALALMGQQGGWPLTMFLSPDGEPFWGGTYFPPEPRYGRPGFPQILEQVAELWRSGNERIQSNRDAIAQALRRLSAPMPGEMPTPELAEEVARQLADQFDTIHGGIGDAPKFPQAPILRLIWDTSLRTGDPTLRHRIVHTLNRISQGGIYDHLGGGYARYAVDAAWLVPHFEKMLYDNAQLFELLGSAWAATGEPLFRARAEETVGWLTREMMVEGAFASSLDADSEGEEGKFYVWDAAEIDRLLGPDARAFRLAYGVTAAGNWEGKNILHRLHEPGLPAGAAAERLARCRQVLLEARETRVRPGRDDKVLADWNGLMIAALAEAAGFFGRPDWLELARSAFAAVLRHMSEDDRLFHSWRAGRRLPMAFLDDYAQMSRAALALFGQTGESTYLDRARAWALRCRQDFRDPAGGYFLSPPSAEGPVVRPKNAHDGPTPSAVGTLAEVLAKLWHLTGEDDYRAEAEAILTAFAGDAERSLHSHATLLLAATILAEPVQIVVIGDEATPGFTELFRVAAEAAMPGRILCRIPPGRGLPASHPAAGKDLLAGRAAAYVCVGTTCEAPVADPAVLRDRLTAPIAAH